MIQPYPSPNFDARPDGCIIDALVLHYTGMPSGAVALARLADPAAKVSAHYCVDESGAIYAMVDEDKRAWHAGLSSWAGRRRLNDVSIGVEIVNPGHAHGLKPFPEAQISAVITLCQAILARHAIPMARVLAHSDIAPSRKLDPGEFFPWERLARAGIGLWPDVQRQGRQGRPPQTITAQRMLAAWGYDIPESGALDPATTAAVAAFQRRYRPRRVDGLFDAECADMLNALSTLGGKSEFK